MSRGDGVRGPKKVMRLTAEFALASAGPVVLPAPPMPAKTHTLNGSNQRRNQDPRVQPGDTARFSQLLDNRSCHRHLGDTDRFEPTNTRELRETLSQFQA